MTKTPKTNCAGRGKAAPAGATPGYMAPCPYCGKYAPVRQNGTMAKHLVKKAS